MKKLSKILAIAISTVSFGFISVEAATCSIQDQYHNSGQFWDFVKSGEDKKYESYNIKQELIYEITALKMNKTNPDVFEVYGWAFNSLKDTDLGGKRGDKTSDDATVELIFYPVDEPNNTSLQVKLDIQYAETSNGNCPTSGCNDRPKYFDYTFWNCYKKRRNGINYCKDQPGDSSGNTHGWTSPTLTGGFKGSIDLKDAYETEKLKKDKEYNLRIVFYRNGKKEFEKDASVYEGMVEDSVYSYKGYDNDAGDDHLNIAVSGFGEKATSIVSKGLPTGKPSGLACASPYNKYSMVYYEQWSPYFVSSDTIQSCRGKIGTDCNSSGTSGNGTINLYGLYGGTAYPYAKNKYRVPKTGGKSGTVSYAPASWLNFNGTITLKTKTKTEDDPKECEGEEKYYLYYYMEDGVAEDFKGNINHNSLYKDAEVLRKWNFNSNLDFSDVEGGPLSTKTVRKNFDKYYDNFWKAIESGTGYIEDGGKYYLVPSEFYKWQNGSSGEAYTFSKDKGYDKNTYVSYNQKAISNSGLTSGLGYSFTIRENIDYSDKNDKPVSIKSGTSALTMNKMYKHFTVYQLTVCRDKQKTPQCPDTVDSAQCIDNDTGTVFTFNENDDKTICTLPKDNHSGFVAIEEGETNGYCSMACKEDLEGYLPTTKETAAGQYFKLDNYVPKIKANRTCVTKEIQYDRFKSDKESLEPSLKKSYNDYRDQFRYNEYVQPFTTTSQSQTVSGSCYDQNGNFTHSYNETISWNEYQIPAFKGPNQTPFGDTGLVKEEGGTCGYDCSGPIPCTGKKLSVYKQEQYDKTISMKASYDGLLQRYSNLFVSYNRCFNWTDPTNDTQTFGGGSGLEPPLGIRGPVTGNHTSEYLYSFEPKVTFNYPDPDGSIFPVEYEYKYGTRDVDMIGFNRNNVYWSYGSKPDNKYENNNSGLDQENQYYFNCGVSDDTCEEKHDPIVLFKNAAVRRDEKVEYTYHLPDVFTSIPSGRVTTKPTTNGTFLQLDKEAVPVNINTFAGTYNYQIKITDLKDELRQRKTDDGTNSPDDDNFEKRFNGSEAPGALNEGEEYVCHYKVVNDIYLPDQKRFNFFYRVVDTYEINPLNRTLGYNWTTGKAGTIRKIMQEDALDYQTLTNNPSREKFVFTLNPVTMQSIRRYNAKQTVEDDGYADWDLECADYGQRVSGVSGYHCTSNFITCLAGGQGDNCGEIVGDVHDNGDYTEEDLKHNRDLLIKKQNELDGRG